MKVREGGRVVKVAVVVATGVNADGYREVLGIHTATTESDAGWLAFFRDLVARGLTGVALVTSDAHAGLVDAVGATLPAASWQRCRTHYAANLMSVTPKSSWWVKALLHSVHDQPTAESLHAQFDRIIDALSEMTARRRRAPRGRPRRHPGLHRVPQGDLATDLVQQPQRAAQR
jgi:transposase-like protein